MFAVLNEKQYSEKSLSPATSNLDQSEVGGGGGQGVIQVGSQIPSCFLVMVWTRAYSNRPGLGNMGQGVAVTDELRNSISRRSK